MLSILRRLLPYLVLLEIGLLIAIGIVAGFLPLLAIVVGTGALGLAVARRHGLDPYARTRADMAEGKGPAAALIESNLVPVAGFLLLIPGVLTDLAGLLLLLPPVRRGVRRRAERWAQTHLGQGVTFVVGAQQARTAGTVQAEVIDVRTVADGESASAAGTEDADAPRLPPQRDS